MPDSPFKKEPAIKVKKFKVNSTCNTNRIVKHLKIVQKELNKLDDKCPPLDFENGNIIDQANAKNNDLIRMLAPWLSQKCVKCGKRQTYALCEDCYKK